MNNNKGDTPSEYFTDIAKKFSASDKASYVRLPPAVSRCRPVAPSPPQQLPWLAHNVESGTSDSGRMTVPAWTCLNPFSSRSGTHPQ